MLFLGSVLSSEYLPLEGAPILWRAELGDKVIWANLMLFLQVLHCWDYLIMGQGTTGMKITLQFQPLIGTIQSL